MCDYEKIISALPEEFRGNLRDGSRRSNPIKIENGHTAYLEYAVVIFSFNCKIEKLFIIRVQKDSKTQKENAFLYRKFEISPGFKDEVVLRIVSATVLGDDYIIEFKKDNGNNLVLEFIND